MRNEQLSPVFRDLANHISRRLEDRETQEDFIIGEEQSRRRAELNNLRFGEVLEMLPKWRYDDLRKTITEEIIDNGWDK